jgi:effector-associated domain 1 (EAD1)-containing protein
VSTFNIGSVSGGNNAFGDDAQVVNSQVVNSQDVDSQDVNSQDAGSRDAGSPLNSEPTGHGQSVTSADGPLLAREVLALAASYPTADQALAFLLRAEVDASALPVFGGHRNALDFWTTVSAELGNGAVVGGRRRLLAAARTEFPAQPAFRAQG